MSRNKKATESTINEDLKNGYMQMADINLELAQMCLEADNESLLQCEEKLTECE